MKKYSNANYEEQVHEDGTTIVSANPITKGIKKEAKEGSKSKDQEVININDRQTEN